MRKIVLAVALTALLLYQDTATADAMRGWRQLKVFPKGKTAVVLSHQALEVFDCGDKLHRHPLDGVYWDWDYRMYRYNRVEPGCFVYPTGSTVIRVARPKK